MRAALGAHRLGEARDLVVDDGLRGLRRHVARASGRCRRSSRRSGRAPWPRPKAAAIAPRRRRRARARPRSRAPRAAPPRAAPEASSRTPALTPSLAVSTRARRIGWRLRPPVALRPLPIRPAARSPGRGARRRRGRPGRLADPLPALAATLARQADGADLDAALDALDHVVDGQRGDAMPRSSPPSRRRSGRSWRPRPGCAARRPPGRA